MTDARPGRVREAARGSMRTRPRLDLGYARRVRLRIEAWHPDTALAAGAAGILVVSGTDAVTGSGLSFAIFYLLPVGFVAWLAAGWRSRLAAAAAASAWCIAEAITTPAQRLVFPMTWNVLSRSAVLLLFAAVLSALRRALDRQTAMAWTDPLTGLVNRRGFVEALREQSAARGEGRAFSICVIHVPALRRVAEALGPAAEDDFAAGLASAVRGATRPWDVVAHISNDELALLLPNTGRWEAAAVVNAVRGVLATVETPDGLPVGADLSVVTILGGEQATVVRGERADELWRRLAEHEADVPEQRQSAAPPATLQPLR